MRFVPLLSLFTFVLAAASAADVVISVGPADRQAIAGWGLFPAAYDRELPSYSDGSSVGSPAWGDASWLPESGASPETLHRAVCGLGFDIARVHISPTIGRSDHSLDPERLQDLKDHLAILRSQGITRYFVTLWSPPAYMKVPDRVRYGRYLGRTQYLDTAFAQDSSYGLADYYAEVLKALVDAGFAAPEAISLQNEPDQVVDYDGCNYTNNAAVQGRYCTVVKLLRARLDLRGLAGVRILATEHAGYHGLPDLLGAASDQGFALLRADPALAAALGGVSYHTYYTSGGIDQLNRACAAHGWQKWMTEYSMNMGIRGELRAASGTPQLDWTLDTLRRMGGDLIDLKTDLWFYWRGWRPSSEPGDQDLLYGPDGSMSKMAWVFRQLWTTVRAGWRLKVVSCSDPALRCDNQALMDANSGDQWSAPVDLIGFEAADRSASCVLLINSSATDRRVGSLSGLKGTTARVFLSDASRDMDEQASRGVSSGLLQGGVLSLPAWSVTLISSSGGPVGPSNQPPSLSFSSPLNGASFVQPANLAVVVAASDPDGSVANVLLYLDGIMVRQENTAPYEWGSGDTALNGLSLGSHVLRAVATDNLGAQSETTITVLTVTAPAGVVNGAGDLNGDRVVNLSDLILVRTNFGKRSTDAGWDARADANGDNVVNLHDLISVRNNFGRTYP